MVTFGGRCKKDTEDEGFKMQLQEYGFDVLEEPLQQEYNSGKDSSKRSLLLVAW
jgi:hypothetical protein